VDEVHKLFAKEDCQRPKEREQADFEQGLDGGWFDHGGGWVKTEKERENPEASSLPMVQSSFLWSLST
jgi:hypothetical protein